MINLRDSKQSGPTVIIGVSVLVVIGTLAYMLLSPVPKPETLAAKERDSEKTVMQAMIAARRDQTVQKQYISSLTFSGSQEDMQTATLAVVAKLTSARKLKLDGFRPQRGVDAGALTQFPFIVTVDGSFNNVVGFTQDLESKGTKLVVNLVQMAASDPSSDNVTANINLAAFLNQPLSSGVQNG